MGSSNILLWNPTLANTESDAAYAADSQRSGGAPTGVAFRSQTGNKLFVQVSAISYSIGAFLASKGYAVLDSDPAGIVAALQSLFANVPGRINLQSIAYSPSLALDASQFLGFQIALTGNTSITISGQNAGDAIAFLFVQGPSGGSTVTWAGNFYGFDQPDPQANTLSVQIGKVAADGTIHASTPSMSQNGINNTPIGLTGQSTGQFVTPVQADSSTNAATTAWCKFGFAAVLSANGYFKMPTWLGGFMVQWGSAGSLNDNTPTAVSFNDGGFPTQCFAVVANDNSNFDVSGNPRTMGTRITSRSAFTITASGSGSSAFWIAVGN